MVDMQIAILFKRRKKLFFFIIIRFLCRHFQLKENKNVEKYFFSIPSSKG